MPGYCGYFSSRFLSTPSARRATCWSRPILEAGSRFLSTPSARRATTLIIGLLPKRLISIHALREEGDGRWHSVISPFTYFYPRPPRGGRLTTFSQSAAHTANFYPRPPRGGRLVCHVFDCPLGLFLSTPSARRATGRLCPCATPSPYFYPRPPRGGRPFSLSLPSLSPVISIHALREEGDLLIPSTAHTSFNFYPRPPRGGRHGLIIIP